MSNRGIKYSPWRHAVQATVSSLYFVCCVSVHLLCFHMDFNLWFVFSSVTNKTKGIRISPKTSCILVEFSFTFGLILICLYFNIDFFLFLFPAFHHFIFLSWFTDLKKKKKKTSRIWEMMQQHMTAILAISLSQRFMWNYNISAFHQRLTLCLSVSLSLTCGLMYWSVLFVYRSVFQSHSPFDGERFITQSQMPL